MNLLKKKHLRKKKILEFLTSFRLVYRPTAGSGTFLAYKDEQRFCVVERWIEGRGNFLSEETQP